MDNTLLIRYYAEYYTFKIAPPRPHKYASQYDWSAYKSVMQRLSIYLKQNPSTKRERYERRKKFHQEGFCNFTRGGK